MRRTYVLTKAGSKARVSRRSGLPAHYRQILALIRPTQHSDEIHLAMCSTYAREQVQSWLDELDTLGFISLMPSGSSAEDSLSDRWRLAIR
jgi:hypothetical protein